MASVKVAVVGVGGIGTAHLKSLTKSPNIQVVGITDASSALRETRSQEFKLPAFANHVELIEKAKPDYILIATPHYSHSDIALDALKLGVHVFAEKPLTVAAARAQECVAAAKKAGVLLGVNFLARLVPANRKMRDLVEAGFLGRTTRVSMIASNWFRSAAYYRSSPWRATWSGEGGGIVVNQSPHDLDQLNWLVGLPGKVFTEMNTLSHDIEVEDDVVGAFKWAGGATGTIHVTTNEAPGRSFIEIAGTRGTLTFDERRLKAVALTMDSKEHSETTASRMQGPPVLSTVTYDLPDTADRFLAMHENFAAAIRTGAPLVCTGEEGVREVEFANALLVSGVKRKWVSTPVDPKEFDAVLAKLVEVKKLAAAQEYFAEHP